MSCWRLDESLKSELKSKLIFAERWLDSVIKLVGLDVRVEDVLPRGYGFTCKT